ncbi:MAG: ATP-binding protein, partial [Chitinophagales bacterium]
KLIDKYNYTDYRARTSMVVNQMILPWKEHLRNSLQPLKTASKTAIKDGDVEMASLMSYFYLTHGFVAGSPIHSLQTATEEGIQWIQELKQERVANLAIMLKQVLENFNNPTENPEKLDGDFYDEAEMLEVFEEKKDHNSFCTHYIYSAQLALYFRKYELALEQTKKMEAHLEAALSTPMVPLYHFFNSLAYLGCYHLLSKKEQRKTLKQVAANQKKMKKWAHHAPMNFKHKYLLVEAERFRVLKNPQQARIFYDRAIEEAFKNQYVQEEGLAHELAARFYQEQNKRHLLKGYIKGAYECYQKWEANTLCNELKEEFSRYFEQNSLFSTMNHNTHSITFSSNRLDSLDLQTIIKSSQTISQEVSLSKLMQRMMENIAENAGAGRGFFMLAKEELLHIEVAYNYQPPSNIPDYKDIKKGTILIDSHLVENINDPKQVFSDKIAYYVARSQQSIILDNAIEDERFPNCIYIQLNKPKSIVCIPILNQGKLLGVMYLENNQLAGAFNGGQKKLLDLLSSQVAISLSNALLYDNLEQKVKERTQEISLQKEEIEEQNKKIEEQNKKIEEQNQLITKRLKYREQFFSNVSHELRTPLTGVMGMTNLLLDTPLNAEQKNYIETVKNSADNLVRIVNDFLDNAKLEAGKLKIIERTFSLSLLLRDIETLLQPKSNKKNLSLVVQSDMRLPEYIVGDKVRIYQILVNLLSNAIKFTEKGEVQLMVSLLEQVENKWKLQFKVSDTGIGVAKDKLETIFESYDQVIDKQGYHYEGTGLGLSIVKQLVDLMEGTISVRSKENVGSTFSIELEFAAVENVEIAAEKNKPTGTNMIPNNWAGKKILILEDNKVNQLYATKLLSKYRFELSIADDITQARQKLNETSFDCLLADVRLPDGDGIEFVGEIQSTEGHLNQHIPVIVLTAGTSEEERKRAKDLTIYGYITKPFDADILRLHLGSVFRKKQLSVETSSESQMNTYFSTLSERMGGDQTAMREILAIFLKQIPVTLQKMKEAVKDTDWESLYAETHHIKSTIQLIGLNSLKTVILKLDDCTLHLKEVEKIPALVDRFEELAEIEVAKVKVFLK